MIDDYSNAPMSDGLDEDIDIDLTNVTEWQGSERIVLPKGEYQMIVRKVERKRSQTSGNEYVSMQFTVSDGEYSGRASIFDNFAIFSSDVALRRIKSLKNALGVPGKTVGKLSAYRGREFIATVGVRDSTRYNALPGDKENTIMGFKPLRGGQPASAPTATQQAQNVQPSEQTQPRVNPW